MVRLSAGLIASAPASSCSSPVRVGPSVGSRGVAALPCPSAMSCSGHPSVAANISPPLLAGDMGKSHVHPCWGPTPTLATSRARHSARKQRTAPAKGVAPLALPTPSQGATNLIPRRWRAHGGFIVNWRCQRLHHSVGLYQDGRANHAHKGGDAQDKHH